tara:strand:- start:3087 stop:3548 length:462 start_codon:yes stop_codon:yes gene_type:complete
MNIKKDIKVTLEKDDLSKLLRIADPFLMIDKAYNIIPGKSGLGVKILSEDSWFYKCHFVDSPVMPGTLQVEAMLQTVIAVIYCSANLEDKNCLITKSSSNFYSKVEKEGELKINAEILNNNRGAIEAKANIVFNELKVSDGSFKFFNPNKLKI